MFERLTRKWWRRAAAPGQPAAACLKCPGRMVHLQANVLTVRDAACLKTCMGWTQDPRLDHEHLRRFQYLEDLNERRLRDAEVVGLACCNTNPTTILEIGTGVGFMTAIMAENAPRAVVHTVNIPPEEIGAGGQLITFAPERGEIGRYYRERGCQNVHQIYANTAQWEPDCGAIDIAFIDGCHDAEFVFTDTRKVLAHCRPGSLILWHDFAPELAPAYRWIESVCQGVERLYEEGLLRGRILHLRDSWVGMYRVPTQD